MPPFYQQPRTIDDLVRQTVVRILDQVGIHLDAPRWSGEMDT
jgi:3-polyprenyl-4-hydroxybenzoate decarboxylase